MTDRSEAVLIGGVFGAGKSTVVEDMATLLEEHGLGYGAIDLDWLAWYHAGIPGDDSREILLTNLAAVAGNYRAAGVDRIVMAGFVADQAEVDQLAVAVGMPLRMVELVVTLEVIERRLKAVGTAERLSNLDEAKRQLAERRGHGFAEFEVDGEQPVREISTEILNRLGWLD